MPFAPPRILEGLRVRVVDDDADARDVLTTILSQCRAEVTAVVPAVALTGYARSEDRRLALLAGLQLHVAKPVQPGEPVAVVASVAMIRRE